MRKYAIDFISDVKIDNWLRRRGPYLQFLTHFVSFQILEWMILEQVDDCEQLSVFVNTEKWNVYVWVFHKYIVWLFYYFLIVLRGDSYGRAE